MATDDKPAEDDGLADQAEALMEQKRHRYGGLAERQVV